MNDKAHLKEKVLALLDGNKLMTLATSDNNQPWAVTVTYAFDKYCNLFFYSDPQTKHCQDILKNSSVAIAIHDHALKPRQVLGMQLVGNASLGDEKDFEIFKKSYSWVTDYPDYKLYKVKPIKLYYLDSELFGHKHKVDVELV